MLISMQSSSNPSEDWSEHLGVGMYALMMIKDFWVYTKFMRNLYFQRSEWEHYRISDEYMLIRNDVEFLESI